MPTQSKNKQRTATAQQSKPEHFDIVIVGGGLVGACLARALAGLPVTIAVLEAVTYQTASQPSFDDRAIALSYGSRKIFEGLGLWSRLQPLVTPITHIHISEQLKFGVTRLSAEQEKVAALGYVITARELGLNIIDEIKPQQNLRFFMPAELTGIKVSEPSESDHEVIEPAQLEFDSNGRRTKITANVVIAADGGTSSVRRLLNIETQSSSYEQTAIVSNITASLPHNNVAYERFTSQGPLALLPMQDNSLSLVWTQTAKTLESILQLDDNTFLSEIQRITGNRLGKFIRAGKRQSYPLRLTKTHQQIKPRLVLVGNAVHTLHPVAGQGFNLGLRDIATLADVLSDAIECGKDIGEPKILQQYADWRKPDHRNTIGFTHGLVKIFSNNITGLSQFRNMGLLATDLSPSFKHILARNSMGLAGRLPRLARGLSLDRNTCPSNTLSYL